jgi:hypothetical protein
MLSHAGLCTRAAARLGGAWTAPKTEELNLMLKSTRAGARATLAATLVGAALMLPASAHAQTAASQGDWKYTGTLYGWFPSIKGSTTFPVDSDNTIKADSGNIIDNLKFVFMGTLDAHNGTWGAFTDVIYLNVSGDKSQTRDFSIGGPNVGVGTTANMNLDLKGWVWTIAGEYRLVSSPDMTMDAVIGARMLDVKSKLDYSLFGNIGSIAEINRSGSRERSENVWDAIVGVKGRYAFGSNHEWIVPYYADVGTGGSEVTWQATAGLGYAFGWGDIVGAYRFLGYNLKSSSRIQDLKFSGPLVAVTFHW